MTLLLYHVVFKVNVAGLCAKSFQGCDFESEGQKRVNMCFQHMFKSRFVFHSWTESQKPLPPCEKEAQLSEENHVELHDCTCLWLYVKDQMSKSFPGEVGDRHQELFENWLLDRMIAKN